MAKGGVPHLNVISSKYLFKSSEIIRMPLTRIFEEFDRVGLFREFWKSINILI